MTQPYVGGFGNGSARLAIVGSHPGFEEADEGIPFVGASGRLLAQGLDEAGSSIGEIYRTNVFKYLPPEGEIKNVPQAELDSARDDLKAELEALGPTAVLSVGDLALYTLTGKTGIQNWRGSILRPRYGNFKVIPTIHPVNLFNRGKRKAIPYRWWAVIKLDIARAVEESRTSHWDIADPKIDIVKSSDRLYSLFEMYKDKDLWASDIETPRQVPGCIGFAPSRNHAWSVPLLNLGSLLANPISERELVNIWIAVIKFFNNQLPFRKIPIKLIGANWKFDEKKLRDLCGITHARESFFADTGMMAKVVLPEFETNLGFLTSIYTKQPYYKWEGREFDISRDSFEKLMSYNARDCATTHWVWKELDEALEQMGCKELYYDYVHKLHYFYSDIEDVGIPFKEEGRAGLIQLYLQKHLALQKEIEQMTGIPKFNSNSNGANGQVANLLQTMKFKKRDSYDEDNMVEMMTSEAKTPQMYRILELISTDRKVKKQITTYFPVPLDFDGRLHTTFRPDGTESNRSSTGNLEPPVRPKIWIGKKKKDIGLSFQQLTKYGDFGVELRELMVPPPGMVIGEADSSQIEARYVALISNDYDLLTLFETADVHKKTAALCFAIAYEKVTKTHRQVGKFVRHGGNYDMGFLKFARHFNKEARKFGIDYYMTVPKAKELLAKFHQMHPNVREVFHEEVRKALQDNGRTLVTPWGRQRTFFARPGPELEREAIAYLPSSTAADNTKHAGLAVKERLPWLPFFHEWHDALYWFCEETAFAEVAAVVKEEMERPLSFERCSIQRGVISIPCEVKIGRENLRFLEEWDFNKAA